MSKKTSKLNRKDLLDIESLSREEINLILETAKPFKELFTKSVKKTDYLRGKTIVNLFYEPSTRTRTSFEIAEKRLGADVINIAVSTSSVVKGESLLDTVKTLLAMKIDAIIMRHGSSGAPHFLADRIKVPVINGGDGFHAHPTQALLDMFTIKENLGTLEGITVALVGDISFSRVARSNIRGLKKMGANVRVIGPSTLIPKDIDKMGVKVYYNLNTGLKGVDVVNILRIQKERQKQMLFPTIREYNRFFAIDETTLTDKNVLVLHPGPMNRGVEISDYIADSEQAVILKQVTNGIAVRMSILYLLIGEGPLKKETAK
ncbi:MAG: aspartate carbamoyltransferase catalytic subunit [Spirochaetes bacterium]|nr:aspartate carbamoyltransferase catalytic subunit [Spirochaetota bacterium]